MHLIKKILFKYAIFCIVLLMFSSNALCYQINNINENPRYHYDVKIILISRVFDTIEIDGYHNLNEGLGYDDLIILEGSNWIRLFGLLLVYDESEVLEQNNRGGWIHTNIEITGYSGWMINQHNDNKNHVIMIGDCEIVKLTAGRG